MNKQIFSFFLFLLLFPAFNFAQAGQIDSTFGTDGHVFLDNIDLVDLVDLPDSSAIVLGVNEFDQDQIESYCYRINYDGSQNTNFGTNGVVAINNSQSLLAVNIAPFDDDRFVVYGTKNSLATNTYDGYIYRFYNDGTIDTSFGDDGVVQFSIAAYFDYGSGLYVTDDKKILVSYNILEQSVVLKSFLPNGDVDMNFGDFGTSEIIFPSDYLDFSTPSLKLNENSLFMLGAIDDGADIQGGFAALKLHTNGEIDTSFGNNGWAFQPIDSLESIGVAPFQLLDDGKMHFAAMVIDSSNFDDLSILTVQLNPDGSLDNSYGDAGISKIPFPLGPDYHEVTGSLIQPDGKFVLFGSLGDEWPFACRLNSNGTLDHSFGTNGFNYWISPDYNEGGNINGAFMNDNSIWGLGYTLDDTTDDLYGLITKYKSGLVSSTFAPLQKLIPMEVYPNPVKEQIQVAFDLDNGGDVALDLMTLSGKNVARLDNSWMAPGKHTNNYILPADLPSGNYLLTLRTGNQVASFVVNVE